MSRLDELLIENGIITEQQLNEALEKQKKDKRRKDIPDGVNDTNRAPIWHAKFRTGKKETCL